MQDAIDKLAKDVKASVIEVCAKVAELHHIVGIGPDEYQRGYNTAVADIAAKIRKL